MLASKAPGSVTFEDDELHDTIRAQVALLLHITPAQVDAMSLKDIHLVLEVNAANKELEAYYSKR